MGKEKEEEPGKIHRLMNRVGDTGVWRTAYTGPDLEYAKNLQKQIEKRDLKERMLLEKQDKKAPPAMTFKFE